MDDPSRSGSFSFRQYQPRALEIIDTTLRDGQQTSLLHDHYKYFFTRTDKEEIARALIIYGVKFIELFAPVVSPQERDDWRAIKDVRDSLITQKGYTFLLAHVRCHLRDAARSHWTGRCSEAGAEGGGCDGEGRGGDEGSGREGEDGGSDEDSDR